MSYNNIYEIFEKFENPKLEDVELHSNDIVENILHFYEDFKKQFFHHWVALAKKDYVRFHKKTIEFLIEGFVSNLHKLYNASKYIETNFKLNEEALNYLKRNYKFIDISLTRIECLMYILDKEITSDSKEFIESLNEVLFIANVGVKDNGQWDYNICVKTFIEKI